MYNNTFKYVAWSMDYGYCISKFTRWHKTQDTWRCERCVCVSQHDAGRRQVWGRRRNSPSRLPLCHGRAQCEPIKRVLPADPSPAWVNTSSPAAAHGNGHSNAGPSTQQSLPHPWSVERMYRNESFNLFQFCAARKLNVTLENLIYLSMICYRFTLRKFYPSGPPIHIKVTQPKTLSFFHLHKKIIIICTNHSHSAQSFRRQFILQWAGRATHRPRRREWPILLTLQQSLPARSILRSTPHPSIPYRPAKSSVLKNQSR